MWPDGIDLKDLKGGTVYMEIGGSKVKLAQIERVRLGFDNKSWRKRLWRVWEQNPFCWSKDPIYFCNRNAAIMWLKRYGNEKIIYRLERRDHRGALVRIENGYVYFYNPECVLMITAESKRTHNYAIRNN